MDPERLEVGKVYFSCGFLLRFRPIPTFQVLVFAGKNLFPNEGHPGEDLYYFQAPEAYFQDEFAFEAAELQQEDYEVHGAEWDVVSGEHIADFVTDVEGLKQFVENLPNEQNARSTLGGVG